MRNLIKFKNTTYLDEIFQSLAVKFAFVTKQEDGHYQQLHTPVKCRDFLGDCIWSKKTGNPVNIYNFQYKYEETPFDGDKLRLSITFPHKKELQNFINNYYTLNVKEALYKIDRSGYWLTDDPLSVIVESSKIWQSSVWKLSLFSFYLKLLSYKEGESLKYPEDIYKEKLTPELEHKYLMSLRKKKEVLSDSMVIAHNCSGFISIVNKKDSEMHKYLLGESK